jgi:hypothetical protein
VWRVAAQIAGGGGGRGEAFVRSLYHHCNQYCFLIVIVKAIILILTAGVVCLSAAPLITFSVFLFHARSLFVACLAVCV